MQYAKFPFTSIGKTYLGTISRPYALIEIGSKHISYWIPAEAIVDTGADYTLFPRNYADLLNVNLNIECKPDTTLGVGGSETIYLCKNLVKIKIGQWQKIVPVGFLERNDVPLLLGRLGCLEVFRLLFNNQITYFDGEK